MQFRKSWIWLVAPVLGLVAAVIYILSLTGVFRKDPHLTIVPDNCYEEKITFVTDEDYWPYSYFDELGNFTGHDIELVNALANHMKVNIEIIPMSWEDALSTAGRQEVDGVLTCEYGDEEETAYGLIMTVPYETGEFVAFGKKPIDKVHKLAGTRIGLLYNGNVYFSVASMGLSPWCVEYNSNREAFEALAAGECDYVLVRYVIGVGILRDMGEKAKDIKAMVPLTRSNFCIGVAGNKPELAARVSESMLELQKNGTIDILSEKWLTTYVEQLTLGDVFKSQPWITFTILFLVLAMMAILMYQFYSKQQEEKSHRAELEKALDSAAQANAAKTKFLFNMSHDIRTPMNAIIGYTAMAEDNLAAPGKVKEYLGKIQIAGRQLLSLINQVLEVSRIESGKVVLESAGLNVAERVRGIADVFEVDMASKGIKCNVEIPELTHPRVVGDVTRISQIMINILGNAIKYTPEGGRIDISAKELPCEKEGCGLYELVVSDTGLGMDPEYVEHIFEEFSREKSSTASGIQGTGLGMAIVKRLVDMMEGTIDVSSEKGRGTRVAIRLPLPFDTAAPSDAAPAAANAISVKGMKVLLVEDNEMNLEIAKYILNEMGVEAIEERDGDSAVQRVKDSAPGDIDIILMDIQMPRMNGYDATRAIRALPDPALASIPIIAMTANAFKEDKDEALRAGMNGHIAKPVDIDQLKSILVNYLPR